MLRTSVYWASLLGFMSLGFALNTTNLRAAEEGPSQAAAPKLMNCRLSDREAMDGVFRIPETVRADKATYDVDCLVAGATELSGTIRVTVTMAEDGNNSMSLFDVTPYTLTPPVVSVRSMAKEALRPGKYAVQIVLQNQGNQTLDEKNYTIEVAMGERYSAPELGKQIDEALAASAAAENPSTSSTGSLIQSMSWKWWAIIAGVGVLILGGWFFAWARQR